MRGAQAGPSVLELRGRCGSRAGGEGAVRPSFVFPLEPGFPVFPVRGKQVLKPTSSFSIQMLLLLLLLIGSCNPSVPHLARLTRPERSTGPREKHWRASLWPSVMQLDCL